MTSIRLAVVGTGSRGVALSNYLLEHPGTASVTAAADPNPRALTAFGERFGVPESGRFDDWRRLLAEKDSYDAVIIATPDTQHHEPALAFLGAGVPLLLEKPMAVDEDECREIARAAQDAGVLFAVCHVLLYTDYTRRVKELVAQGIIGDVVSVQHLEPVGYWHQAHSFVRGNWRTTKSAAFMLLQKCCHDLDWLRHVVASRVSRVASFGRLTHFHPGSRPPGSSDRCTTCPVEASCPSSAPRFYLGRFDAGDRGWPLDVLANPVTRPALEAALATGPYGRCVYACDNDVVDHQVVILDYESGVTATLTMTAFTEQADRKTTLFGTRGEMRLDGQNIEVFDFLTDKTTRYEVATTGDSTVAGGHGGGDFGLMAAFLDAMATGDASGVLSNAATSLESHLIAFAAETARLEGRVVALNYEKSTPRVEGGSV